MDGAVEARAGEGGKAESDGRAEREGKQAGERGIGMQEALGEGESIEGGREKRGKTGMQWRRGPGPQREKDLRNRRRRKEAANTRVRRGWGLREAGAWRKARQLLASIQTLKTRGLCLTLRVRNRCPSFVEGGTPTRERDCSGLGPAPGARQGFSGPGLGPEGRKPPAWKLGPRKEGTTAGS